MMLSSIYSHVSNLVDKLKIEQKNMTDMINDKDILKQSAVYLQYLKNHQYKPGGNEHYKTAADNFFAGKALKLKEDVERLRDHGQFIIYCQHW